MPIVRVAVFQSGNQYLVRPPVVILLRNAAAPQADQLRVSNHTGYALQVGASGEWPFSASPPQGMDPGGQVTLNLASNVDRGVYSYRIMVQVGQKQVEALGNSDPVVIVEDP